MKPEELTNRGMLAADCVASLAAAISSAGGVCSSGMLDMTLREFIGGIAAQNHIRFVDARDVPEADDVENMMGKARLKGHRDGLAQVRALVQEHLDDEDEPYAVRALKALLESVDKLRDVDPTTEPRAKEVVLQGSWWNGEQGPFRYPYIKDLAGAVGLAHALSTYTSSHPCCEVMSQGRSCIVKATERGELWDPEKSDWRLHVTGVCESCRCYLIACELEGILLRKHAKSTTP